jgi:hypothetical protein
MEVFSEKLLALDLRTTLSCKKDTRDWSQPTKVVY